jgi:hypothetical protein
MSDDERPADQTDARDLCTVAALAQPLQGRHGEQAPAAVRHLDVAKEYLARCERAAALAAGQPWPPKGRSNTKPRITTSTPNAAPPQVGLRLRIPGTEPAKIALTAPVPSTPPTDHRPGLWVRGSRRIL